MNLTDPARRSVPRTAFKRLQAFGRIVSRHGGQAFLVGGPVRDILLRQPLRDIDVVATHPVEPVLRALANQERGLIARRSAFLTFKLSFPDGTCMDVATARKETYPQAASLPVVEPSEILHDLARRDFSINAMAVELGPRHFGELIDPLGGEMDLAARRLRALHSQSFQDDPTRIYRAARYAGRLNLRWDGDTLNWIRSALRLKMPAQLTTARLSHEWEKILLEQDPRATLKILDGWGALTFLDTNWHWKRTHARTLRPGKNEKATLSGRLLGWCRPFGTRKAEGALAHLELPAPVRGEVRLGLGLLENIEREDPLSALGAAKAPESVRNFLSQNLPAPLWKRVLRSRPLLSGTDLMELGAVPGPELGRILAALTQARWRDTVRSRRDEVRFVIDNLRGR